MHKNNLLIFFTCCLTSLFCWSQTTLIPDPNFEQALIDLGYDIAPINGSVPTININTIDHLDVNLKNITNLTGIEDFNNLTILECTRNQLTNFDVSQNIKLEQLYCNGNQLNNIDVTKNINLQILWCYSNLLTALDVTKNSNLISLVCWENNLTNLDTSNNTELVVLGCEMNKITSLNLTNNKKLSRFQCRDNLLTSLDITNNTNLSSLDCGLNQLTNLDLSNNKMLNTLLCSNNNLIELDLTQNPLLLNFECINNNLCVLNIKSGNNDNIAFINFDSNPDLSCVIVDEINGDHSIWEPSSFTNYVNSINQCGNSIPIDSLNDFVGTSYTLPILNNGNYFTQSNGTGIPLNAGDIITTPQTIYIYKETGCNSNESKFNVLITLEDYIIPKYFTPNNDGFHDFWNVYDATNSISDILIFNRYGKLLKSINSNSNGWNGTFNGQPLRSDDYWYQIRFNTGEVLKGHFTLKR